MQSWRNGPVAFLFPSESNSWVSILQFGLGLQIVLYSLALASDWNYLLSATGTGLVSRDLAEGMVSLESRFVPRLSWIISIGQYFGLSEQTMLSFAWICLLCSGCFLLVGFLSRPMAVLAWFFHTAATKSGGLISYGMDSFTTIGLFYLMIVPLPVPYSLDWRLRKLRPKYPQLAGFFRRALQLHLSVAYFFSGLTKCLGRGWWNGSNLWRALTRQPFNMIAPELLVKLKYLFPVMGIAVCLLEIAYPIFMWNKKTRLIWLSSICAMHIGIGIAMGMYLFALIMIVLNLAAFVPELCSRSGQIATRQAFRALSFVHRAKIAPDRNRHK